MSHARSAQARKAAEEFQALHEGRPAGKIIDEPIDVPMGALRYLGHLEEIQYRKTTTEKNAHSYKHPFELHAQPELLVDANGQLFVRGYYYYTTAHGIEDRAENDPTSRIVSSIPKRFVTLGKLEWIRYNNGQQSAVLYFRGAQQPDIAHDELGKLHVLRGNYFIRREDTMARRRRHHRKGASRHNPVGKLTMDKALHMGATTAIVSGAAMATMYGAAKLVGMRPSLSPVAKAVITGVGSFGAALGAMVVGAPPALAAGVAVGGAISAASQGMEIYRVRSLPQGGAVATPPANMARYA